jgi:hypothetical protein
VILFRIQQFDGNSAHPGLAEDYARYGSLLLKLAIRNNDQNLLASNSAAAADVNEASAAALLQTGYNKKKLIDLGEVFEEAEDEGRDAEHEEEAELEEEAESIDPIEAAFEEAQTEGQDEADDDFTIAWENLDVARLLFERRIESCQDETERSELAGKLARVLQDLGDLCLEDGNSEIH